MRAERPSSEVFSFGETTADDESWKDYSKGIAEAVRELNLAFKAGGDRQVLRGKRFYVGGASLGGSFSKLRSVEHATIKKAIEGVGGTLIYAYKSFHSRKGLPESTSEDLANTANAKKSFWKLPAWQISQKWQDRQKCNIAGMEVTA